jgi:hypothetical protein
MSSKEIETGMGKRQPAGLIRPDNTFLWLIFRRGVYYECQMIGWPMDLKYLKGNSRCIRGTITEFGRRD